MDIFVFTNTIRLHFCITDGDRQVFHRDMIIVIRFFFILILPQLNEISFFSVDKIPLVHTMTLCFKAVVNIDDKHSFNLDKFHLCVKLLLSCPGF